MIVVIVRSKFSEKGARQTWFWRCVAWTSVVCPIKVNKALTSGELNNGDGDGDGGTFVDVNTLELVESLNGEVEGKWQLNILDGVGTGDVR